MNSALISIFDKKHSLEKSNSQSTLADKLSSLIMFVATLAVVGVLGLTYIA
ncbi:hypothetical protein [Vibrio ziniensis]|uniref:Uncharacterized protein n=1 Tax=Vibrio ziniensis TaxID=2711221 RepID=A0A6G7CGA0_9VIBR|nr:hypothetical protein [Vibrio ziniensis]QIH41114.1 hypothetical protein G5S32_03540 [Vibrio ziniensis]